MALARLKSVAGVTIPDTALCNAAVDLLESSSPEFLCTHCLRTYIFGSLAVRSLGRSIADDEAAFCAAALHDLGLVPAYRRDNRFEVDGADAARQFFHRALGTLKVTPTEVVTDATPVYPRVLDDLVPAAWHHVERYANNRIEADHSRLKQRPRPMRGLRTDRTAQVIIAGLGFMQNVRRVHYELGADAVRPLRVATAFDELAQAI